MSGGQATTAGALAPGQVVAERYIVERRIGHGNMATVWSAVDTELGRVIALKIAHEPATRPGGRLLAREAVLLARVEHPGVPRIHAHGQHDERLYLVTERVDGWSIEELVRRVAAGGGSGGHELTRHWLRAVAAISAALAFVVHAVHARGVLHRDIKASNVMLRGGTQPVLVDFGLAGTVRDRDRRGLFGSPRSLAPEQVRSRRMGADPRSDIYQLGLLLYRMSTLRDAFAGEDAGDVLDRIAAGRCPRPRELNPRIPAQLERLCLGAMAPEPESRPATPRALGHALEAWLLADAAGRSQLGRMILAAREWAGTLCGFVSPSLPA